MPGVAPLNRCIRISAAPNREMEILAETLPQVVSEIG